MLPVRHSGDIASWCLDQACQQSVVGNVKITDMMNLS